MRAYEMGMSNRYLNDSLRDAIDNLDDRIHDISTVASNAYTGMQSLKAKSEATAKRLEALEARADALAGRIQLPLWGEEMTQRLDALERRVTGLTGSMEPLSNAVDARFQEMTQRLDTLGGSTLRTIEAHGRALESLRYRATKTENALEMGNSTSALGLDDRITAIVKRVAGTEKLLETHDTRITAAVDRFERRIDAEHASVTMFAGSVGERLDVLESDRRRAADHGDMKAHGDSLTLAAHASSILSLAGRIEVLEDLDDGIGRGSKTAYEAMRVTAQKQADDAMLERRRADDLEAKLTHLTGLARAVVQHTVYVPLSPLAFAAVTELAKAVGE